MRSRHGGNRERMREKERGLFPDLGQQFVEIVGSRRARERKETLFVVDVRDAGGAIGTVGA